MGFPYEGEIYSLLSAIVWAIAVVLFKLSGQRVPPLALNFFKNTVAVILFALTLAFVGNSFFPDIGAVNYLLLALSGAVGLAIADTLYFRALNVLGAGLLSIVTCLYSPSVIVFSVLLLGERPSVGDLVGAAMILSSVVLSSRHKPPPGVARRQLIGGILVGAVSAIFMGLGVAIAKPALNETPVIWATAFRLFVATLMLGFITSLTTSGRTTWTCFRPSRDWRITLPTSIIGAYLAMIFWIAGIKYTLASVASILNQTSVIFVLPFAFLILGEEITKKKLIAVVIALAGVVLVTLA